MTEIRCLRTADELRDAEPEWNSILERSAASTPFLSHEWIRTWWSRFGEGRELRVLAAFENGRLAAVAPLALGQRHLLGVPMRILEIVGTGKVAGRGMGLADRSGFLVPQDRPDLLRHLLRGIATDAGDWDLLRLKAIPADGDLARAVEAGGLGPGFRVRRFFHDASPYVPCEETWEAFLAAKSKSFRKALRKRRNRLRAHEGFAIDRHVGDACVLALPRIFAVSDRSWKGEAGSALLASSSLREFLLDLARALAPREGLVLYVLRLEDRPVAYELCFRGPRSLVAYDAAYDPSAARLSPGALLSSWILEWAHRDGIPEYDQSRGLHAYKLQWSDRTREEAQIVIVRSGLRPTAGYLAEVRLPALAKRVPGASFLHDRLAGRGSHR